MQKVTAWLLLPNSDNINIHTIAMIEGLFSLVLSLFITHLIDSKIALSILLKYFLSSTWLGHSGISKIQVFFFFLH